MVAMVTDNGCQNRENGIVSIVYKGTYELSAQLSLKWGKSGVGFTMINIDVFFQDFSIKSYVMVFY